MRAARAPRPPTHRVTLYREGRRYVKHKDVHSRYAAKQLRDTWAMDHDRTYTVEIDNLPKGR